MRDLQAGGARPAERAHLKPKIKHTPATLKVKCLATGFVNGLVAQRVVEDDCVTGVAKVGHREEVLDKTWGDTSAKTITIIGFQSPPPESCHDGVVGRAVVSTKAFINRIVWTVGLSHHCCRRARVNTEDDFRRGVRQTTKERQRGRVL